MGLNDWWYYTGSTTKALVIIGVVAMALLAVILASPYVKPLQFITTKLGLVQEKIIYIPVPVNHTVYVNRTIVEYVNQTVPVYINRTVIKYVPVPVNQTTFVVTPGNQQAMEFWWNVTGYIMGNGWAWGRIIVLPNGTAWFVGTAILPDSFASELGLTSCVMNCFNWSTPYGVEYESAFSVSPAVFLVNGSRYSLYLPGFAYSFVSNYTLNYPFPGYTVVVYGDTTGYGPSTITGPGFKVVLNGNGTVTIITPQGNGTFAINSTYYGYAIIPYYHLIPVRLDIIYAPNPQAALGIPIPFAKYVATAITYIGHGVPWIPTISPIRETFGFWVWNYNVTPINET